MNWTSHSASLDFNGLICPFKIKIQVLTTAQGYWGKTASVQQAFFRPLALVFQGCPCF